jgi:hypothetical protein
LLDQVAVDSSLGGGGIGKLPSARRVVPAVVSEKAVAEGGGGIGKLPSAATRVVPVVVSENAVAEGGGGIGKLPSAQVEIVEVGAAFRAVTCVLTVERLEATIVSSSALPTTTKKLAVLFMRNTS